MNDEFSLKYYIKKQLLLLFCKVDFQLVP